MEENIVAIGDVEKKDGLDQEDIQKIKKDKIE